MLDLCNLPTTAMMRLAKASPRRDGSSVCWDYDLSMEVPDADAAELVDVYVPGAARAYAGGADGARGKASTTGGFDLCAVELVAEDGTHLARGHAEVKQATVSCTAAQAVLVVRLRVHGLLERAATDVVYRLDEVVQVRLDTQGAPRLSVADAVGVRASGLRGPGGPASLVGRLVVVQQGDEAVAGLVTEHSGSMVHVQEMGADFVTACELGEGRPATVLDVVAPQHCELDAMLEDYVERCADSGLVPSWHDVITAIGHLYAQQLIQARPDFAWELVPRVWDAALDNAAQASGVVVGEA
jgi:hypothetical protein